MPEGYRRRERRQAVGHGLAGEGVRRNVGETQESRRSNRVRLRSRQSLPSLGVRMFSTAEDLLGYVKDEGVEFIDVRFCDLPGIMQHFTVPVSSFGPEVFEEGLMFDGSSVRGFQQIHESDMALMPDPTTAFVDTFRGTKTLAINFFVRDPLTGEAHSRDPRNIARKAQEYLKSTGIADTAFFAPEAEFYV